jgi:Tfp pilus assembly PilM family ATPase
VFFSKSKNVVGLDIGSSAIKLVELKEKKGGSYSLVKLGSERYRRRPSSTVPSWTPPWWSRRSSG